MLYNLYDLYVNIKNKKREKKRKRNSDWLKERKGEREKIQS